MTPLQRGETKKTAMPDDRPEPVDRAAEQESPWDRDPAEERDRLRHVSYDTVGDW